MEKENPLKDFEAQLWLRLECANFACPAHLSIKFIPTQEAEIDFLNSGYKKIADRYYCEKCSVGMPKTLEPLLNIFGYLMVFQWFYENCFACTMTKKCNDCQQVQDYVDEHTDSLLAFKTLEWRNAIAS
jgi:hypothetical protein